jgi:hypothetical protein
VAFDANGNIFGTASEGGTYGFGVVFEITAPPGDFSQCAKSQ